MKILYIVSNLERGGPINVLFNIVKEVCNEHLCQIVTLSIENKKSMIEDFENLNVIVNKVGLNRRDPKSLYISKLENIIMEFKPDIIHTHGYRSDRYIAMINKYYTFKHVTTLHNFPFSDYPRLYGLVKGTILSVLHLHTINQIQYKIACSNSILNKYIRFNILNIFSIQNGVDINLYKSVSNDKKNILRTELGLPIEKTIIVSIGALIDRKRPIALIEAFKRINGDVLLIVLGDGKLYNRIKKYNNEDIKVLGSVKNVVDYLQASDIFVSNSKAEGLPMAMLEAASTGLLIVGSDIMPHREVEEVYKNKTILYRGQNIEVISECIKKSISKISGSRDQNEEPFELSSYNMAKKYMDYYKHILVN